MGQSIQDRNDEHAAVRWCAARTRSRNSSGSTPAKVIARTARFECSECLGRLSRITEGLGGVITKAGLTKKGAHVLRHTFCSHLSMCGAPARAIQEAAGHQDLRTTQPYMPLSPSALDGRFSL